MMHLIINEIDSTFNDVFRSMTFQEINTIHTVCEFERNQLITKLAMPVQNCRHWILDFFLRVNRTIFLYDKGFTAWLYGYPYIFSPLYKVDRCFDRNPIHFKNTLMYIESLT